ncbi:MAG: GTP pyrophosphokinase family protein [Oscillospiraceae bacterium]
MNNTAIIDENETAEKELVPVVDKKQAIEWLESKSMAFRELMAYYNCAIMEIETKFKVLNEEFSLQHDRNPIETIKSRLKSPNSILEKLQRKGLSITPEDIENNIFDVAGIRIICSFTKDIYLLADCLLNQDDITLIEVKDYIKRPKPNGYRSLHLIVEVPIFLAEKKKAMKVEIQLRTIAMDFWASLEHKLRYKKDIDNTEYLSNELRECAEQSASLDNRMENIREMIENS